MVRQGFLFHLEFYRKNITIHLDVLIQKHLNDIIHQIKLFMFTQVPPSRFSL